MSALFSNISSGLNGLRQFLTPSFASKRESGDKDSVLVNNQQQIKSKQEQVNTDKNIDLPLDTSGSNLNIQQQRNSTPKSCEFDSWNLTFSAHGNNNTVHWENDTQQCLGIF